LKTVAHPEADPKAGLGIEAPVDLQGEGLRAQVVHQEADPRVDLRIVARAALLVDDLRIVARAVPLVDGLRIVDQGQVSRRALKTAQWRILDLAAVEEVAHLRQIHLPVKRGRISARVESLRFDASLPRTKKPKDN
jgi:hypothetical protein